MKIFHPKDSREVLECFTLRHDWFKQNENNLKWRKPNAIPEEIAEALRRSIKNQDFSGETAYLKAIESALQGRSLNHKHREILLDAARTVKREQIENFSLQFTHFLEMELKKSEDDGSRQYKADLPNNNRLPDKALQALNALKARQKLLMRDYMTRCPLESFQRTLDWRMIVGLGSEHVRETSMTLHHVYGIPYIPGSALKGLARQYFISERLEPECRQTEARLNAQDYERLKERFPEHVAQLEELGEERDGEWHVELAGQKGRIDENFFAALEGHVPRENLEKLDILLSTPDLNALLKEADAEMQLEKQFELRDATIRKVLSDWDTLHEGQRIFGTQNRRGAIVFFDAYPVSDAGSKVTFEVDIMNPHYQNYYNNEKHRPSPHDSHDPIPVKFLTVAGTTFTFYVGENVPGATEDAGDAQLANKVSDWLQTALEEQGVGAKSAVGYGYFTQKSEPAHTEVQATAPKHTDRSGAQGKPKEIASNELLKKLAAQFNK